MGEGGEGGGKIIWFLYLCHTWKQMHGCNMGNQGGIIFGMYSSCLQSFVGRTFCLGALILGGVLRDKWCIEVS